MSALIVAGIAVLSVGVALQIDHGATADAAVGLRTPRPDNVLSPGLQGDASLGRYTAQRARFMTSDDVLGAVAATLGVDDLTALRGRIEVRPSSTSNLVSITARADTPEAAVGLAQALVDAYGSETQRQVEELTAAAVGALQAEIEQVAAASTGSGAAAAAAAGTAADLESQIADLEASAALLGDGVEFVVAPREESAVVAGFPMRELALGLAIGLAVAAAVAWARADRDRRVASTVQAQEALGYPLLAELPGPSRFSGSVGELAGLPGHECRLLWSSLSQVVPQGVVVVQAVGPAVVSHATTVNLAAAAAREQLSTLVVDARVATGELSALLGRPRLAGGLSGVLQNTSAWADEIATVDAGGRYEFSLLPAGPQIDEVDVSTGRLHSYVDEWRSGFDYVLVVTDAFGSSQLSAKLAGAADGVVFVVTAGIAERDLREIRRQADLLGTRVLGFVFGWAGSSGRVRDAQLDREPIAPAVAAATRGTRSIGADAAERDVSNA